MVFLSPFFENPVMELRRAELDGAASEFEGIALGIEDGGGIDGFMPLGGPTGGPADGPGGTGGPAIAGPTL